MNYKEFNLKRLNGVSEKEWREALDEVTAYLRWRLAGKTQRGAHSELELGMPALDYYQEEAVVKLIEGEWKWQERFTLGKQLEKIAANLITKQCERYQRLHPGMDDPECEMDDPSCAPLVVGEQSSSATGSGTDEESMDTDGECPAENAESAEKDEMFARRAPQFVEVMNPERLPDTMDDDGQEELDETNEVVMALVADNEELTLYVQAIQECNSFFDLPDKMGIPIKRVYRLQEKLMRRINSAKKRGLF